MRLICPGGGAVALFGDLFPDDDLAQRVGGEREGLQALEVDDVLAVGLDQLGGGVAEAQALLDGAFGDAEAGGDRGDGGAGAGEDLEGFHLSAGCMAARIAFSASEISVSGRLGGDDPAGNRHVRATWPSEARSTSAA